MKKLGFIGAGNMATAMMSGVIRSGIFSADEIIMSDISAARLDTLREEYGVATTISIPEITPASCNSLPVL